MGLEGFAGVGFKRGDGQRAAHAGFFQGLEGGFVSLAAGVVEREGGESEEQARQERKRNREGGLLFQHGSISNFLEINSGVSYLTYGLYWIAPVFWSREKCFM